MIYNADAKKNRIGSMTKSVTEKELIYFSKKKLIDLITIKQIENGQYEIFFNLKKVDTKYFLETQRGEVRTWVSLDRLISHIRKFYEPIEIIRLEIRREIKHEQKH